MTVLHESRFDRLTIHGAGAPLIQRFLLANAQLVLDLEALTLQRQLLEPRKLRRERPVGADDLELLLFNLFLIGPNALPKRRNRRAGRRERDLLLQGSLHFGKLSRHLRNLIERVMILTSELEDGKRILPAVLLGHLEEDAVSLKQEGAVTEATGETPFVAKNLRDARSEFEKEFILKTLKENDWNVSKTASVLGIERSHLHRKIKSYGIEAET